MLEPKTINGNLFTDDRGTVSFINDFNFSGIKRFYQVENHTVNFIRAWHGHEKEAKYVYVVKGVAIIHALPITNITNTNIDTSKIYKAVLTSNNPKILYIPPGFVNGFKTLQPDTILQFFSNASLEESLKDDIRFDSSILLDIWKEKYR